MACTIHANSASDALDALVNAALMAGENVPERVVRKAFSSSINLVVHLDRGMDQSGSRMIRETMEIRAVVPALHEDFSTEAIFSRDRLGSPLLPDLSTVQDISTWPTHSPALCTAGVAAQKCRYVRTALVYSSVAHL
jgi:hypothetical protein